MKQSEFLERLRSRFGHAGMATPEHLCAGLFAYLELLQTWNCKINLTALPLEPPTDEALDRLLVEPLAAAPLAPNGPAMWLDIGSGGGSPAIPMKLARPDLELLMIESKSRKAAFLNEAVRIFGLRRSAVHHGRFEDVAAAVDRKHSADFLTSRAVKADAGFFAAAHQVLKPGGTLILFRSAADPKICVEQFELDQPLVNGLSERTRLDRFTPNQMFHVEHLS